MIHEYGDRSIVSHFKKVTSSGKWWNAGNALVGSNQAVELAKAGDVTGSFVASNSREKR
jgi:hypothetical protein